MDRNAVLNPHIRIFGCFRILLTGPFLNNSHIWRPSEIKLKLKVRIGNRNIRNKVKSIYISLQFQGAIA